VADFWSASIRAFHALAPFDGLWIDMNEPSNFNDGNGREGGGEGLAAVARRRRRLVASSTPSSSTVPFPQYPPNNGGVRLPLNSHTVPPEVVSADGSTPTLDTHNLYGHAEAAATHAALLSLAPGRRPFILTRSSFVGTGAYAAHWTGDNAATWADLAWSISGVLASGLAGLPMAGADVCGFSGNTTAELCGRWAGVAALQPFFRDHSDLQAAPQELYLWPDGVRAALAWRYAVLPVLYTALARAAATGAPAARPLWFDFPGVAGARVDRPAWMVGSWVMAAPAVEAAVREVEVWLPAGSEWVDLRGLVGEGEGGLLGGGQCGVGRGRRPSTITGRRGTVLGRPSNTILRASPSPPTSASPPPPPSSSPPPSSTVTLAAPLGVAPPTLLRCGGVVALAAPAATAQATLAEAPLLHLVACLGGEEGTAAGELFADDGVSVLAGDCASAAAADADASAPAAASPTPASTAAWFDLSADAHGLAMSVRGGGRLAPGLAHWPRVGRVSVVGFKAGGGEVSVVGCDGNEAEACATVDDAGVLVVVVGGGGVQVVCGDGRAGMGVAWRGK